MPHYWCITLLLFMRTCSRSSLPVLSFHCPALRSPPLWLLFSLAFLAEPIYQLCYENRKGCWVGGKQGNNCAYIDPAGNGGPYARNCSEPHRVVCYAKYP